MSKVSNVQDVQHQMVSEGGAQCQYVGYSSEHQCDGR